MHDQTYPCLTICAVCCALPLQFTAFKTTVKATAHQVGAWVRGGVASCVPGGQEEAVIDWDGAKPTVLRGDTPPPQVAHQVPLPASPKENTAAPAPAGDLRAASEEHHIEGAADALGAPCPAGHLVVSDRIAVEGAGGHCEAGGTRVVASRGCWFASKASVS
jgi:hypothetical protein